MTIATSKKLLVLDQDTLGENFLKQALNPNGYEIIKVSSSAEGILTSQTWNPDVIIINLMQPPDNGWILCKKLREFSQAPILVLATVSDPKSIAQWLDAGADDYLTKPFSSKMLIAHLQKLTRNTKIIQTTSSRTQIH
jgi:two-component system KDP operon response regulator KdpE